MSEPVRRHVSLGNIGKNEGGMKRNGMLGAFAVVAVLVGIGFLLNQRGKAVSSLDAKVAQMLPLIEQALGLEFKEPPAFDTRSREQVREFLIAQLEEGDNAKELAHQELVLKQLGLLEPEQSLRQIYVDVLEEQIAGFYDPKTDVLHVVDGTTPEISDITVTHELIHALQDQYIRLDSIQDLRGQDDRQLAAHAIMEGQATLEQMFIMMGRDITSFIPGGWEGIRDVLRVEQAKMPKFAAAPLVVQEMLLFPYISGADFVRRYKEANPGKNVLQDIPSSTEQLLHTRAFFPERDHPTEVSLPAPSGFTRLYENTMGEFGMRIFLQQHLKNYETSLSGAMGWDGDRYVLFRGEAGPGIAWVSVWDSAVDAAEFRQHLATTIDMTFRRPPEKRIPAASRPGYLDGTEYRTADRVFYVAAAEISGRPAVIYVSVPAGASTDVIDIRQVTISQPG